MEKVPGIDRAVSEERHDTMDMDNGFAILIASDAAGKRGDLHLLLEFHDLERLFGTSDQPIDAESIAPTAVKCASVR